MLAPAFLPSPSPPSPCHCPRRAVKQRRVTPCRSLRLFKWEACNSGIHRPARPAHVAQRRVRVMRAKKFHPGNSSSIPSLLAVLLSIVFSCLVSLALFRHARHRALPRRACLDVVARFIPVPYFSYFTRNFPPLFSPRRHTALCLTNKCWTIYVLVANIVRGEFLDNSLRKICPWRWDYRFVCSNDRGCRRPQPSRQPGNLQCPLFRLPFDGTTATNLVRSRD